jgi:hypothetical protein
MQSRSQASMFRLFALIVALVLPLCARSECSSDPAQIKLALPPEALSIRNALFSRLCEGSNGQLVDITDQTLAGRLTPPRDIIFLSDRSGNPGELRDDLVFAFLVDLDGSLRDTTIIISSGNKKLDERRSLTREPPGRCGINLNARRHRNYCTRLDCTQATGHREAKQQGRAPHGFILAKRYPAIGDVCYRAFKAISEQHGFSPDFPVAL